MNYQELLYVSNPDPMLVFDIDTMEILDVNDSAVEKYGYTRDEFTNLSLKDIRPDEDIKLLVNELVKMEKDPEKLNHGAFRHLTKQGDVLFVNITTYLYPFKGRNSRMAHIHDVTEQVRLKNEIQQAYRELKHHINNNPLALVKYNSAFEIIEWSDRAVEISGYVAEEVMGKNVLELDLVPDGEQYLISEKIEALVEGECNKQQFDTYIINRKEERVDLRVHASAKRDNKGKLESVVAFHEDITRQKKNQQELREIRNRFEIVTNTTADVVWDWNIKEQTVWWSNEIYDQLNFLVDDVEHTVEWWQAHVHPDDRDDVKQQLHQILNGREKYWEAEYRFKKGDGTYCHIHDRAQIIRDLNGKPNRVIGAMSDITERKKIELELSKRSKAIEVAMDGIAILDADDRYVYMNKAHARIYGYDKPVELVGKKWKVLYRKKDISFFEDVVIPELSKKGSWMGEAWGKRKDESVFPQEISLSKLEDGGMICIVRDITDRKEKEKQALENGRRYKRSGK